MYGCLGNSLFRCKRFDAPLSHLYQRTESTISLIYALETSVG